MAGTVASRDDGDTRDQLLARAGHDLRTPLGAVLAWALLLKREALSAEGGHALEMLERSARALGELLAGFDDARALLGGRLEPQRAPFDLAAELRQVVAAQGPAAQARGVELVLLDTAGAVPAQGDAPRVRAALGRVLAQLVALATSRKRVEFRAESRGREAALHIDCPGLELPPLLREAATRLDGWPPLSGASGRAALDFALAARVVALMGGRVELAESGPDTRLRVILLTP